MLVTCRKSVSGFETLEISDRLNAQQELLKRPVAEVKKPSTNLASFVKSSGQRDEGSIQCLHTVHIRIVLSKVVEGAMHLTR